MFNNIRYIYKSIILLKIMYKFIMWYNLLELNKSIIYYFWFLLKKVLCIIIEVYKVIFILVLKVKINILLINLIIEKLIII